MHGPPEMPAAVRRGPYRRTNRHSFTMGPFWLSPVRAYDASSAY
jgi:hypothetical protein